MSRHLQDISEGACGPGQTRGRLERKQSPYLSFYNKNYEFKTRTSAENLREMKPFQYESKSRMTDANTHLANAIRTVKRPMGREMAADVQIYAYSTENIAT